MARVVACITETAVTDMPVGLPYLQSENLPPGGCIPRQAPLMQEVQALRHHSQLRLPCSASRYEDAIHQEGVDQVLRHCCL